jgi:hypothetical protein
VSLHWALFCARQVFAAYHVRYSRLLASVSNFSNIGYPRAAHGACPNIAAIDSAPVGLRAEGAEGAVGRFGNCHIRCASFRVLMAVMPLSAETESCGCAIVAGPDCGTDGKGRDAQR